MPSKKPQTLADVTALGSNIGSSVLLIYCNKYVMSSKVGFGFTFGEQAFRLPAELHSASEVTE